MKKNYLLTVFGISILWVAAQSSSAQTPTPTSTPDCCQLGAVWNPPTFGNIYGVAVNRVKHRVYANDPGAALVRVLQYDGTPDPVTPTLGGGVLTQPLGIAIAPDGKLFVSEYITGIIHKIDPVTGNVTVFVTVPTADAKMVQVDDNNNVYVSTNNGRVYEFDPTGAAAATLTGMSEPSGMLKEGNSLLVGETSAFQVTRFVETAPYVYSGPTPVATAGVSGALEPFQMAKDPAGNYYAANGNSGGYIIFDPQWNEKVRCTRSELQPGIGLAVDEFGAIYETQGASFNVTKIDPCSLFVQPTPTPFYEGGNPPSQSQCFIYPSPAKGDHARLSYFMAESGKMTLKIWNQNGELAAEIKDQKPSGVQVTPFSLTTFTPGIYFYVVTLDYNSGKKEKLATKKFAVVH